MTQPDFTIEELVNELGLKDLTIIQFKRQLKSQAQIIEKQKQELENLKTNVKTNTEKKE